MSEGKWSDWIDWNGGECPLPDGEPCCVKYRNGEVRINVPAKTDGGLVSEGGFDTTDAYWKRDGKGMDIIAYRYKIKEPESDMHPDLRWENPSLFNITYNPDSGELRWIKIPRGARRDGVCGTIHTDRRGYRSRIINTGGYSYKAHRIAWFKVYWLPIPEEIDHIDGDGTNNAIKNLRASDSARNKRNRHMQSNNVSGFTGVRKHSNGNGWNATIQVNGRAIHLGYFMNLEEAIRARVSAEHKYNFTPRHGRKKRADHEF